METGERIASRVNLGFTIGRRQLWKSEIPPINKGLGERSYRFTRIVRHRIPRHLSLNGLTPEEYRARYNLKPDYPMVAESYLESRRAMAKMIGLGRKPAADAAPADTSTEAKHAPRKRLKLA